MKTETKLVDDGGLQYYDVLNAFPRKNYTKRPSKIKVITIHVTETISHEKTRQVLAARGLSTHFEVERDGKIYRYLDPVAFRAYHAGWVNAISIGIDVTHHGSQEFPEVQIESVKRLVKYLQNKISTITSHSVAQDGVKFTSVTGIPADIGIIRHRNISNTDCPGKFPVESLAC